MTIEMEIDGLECKASTDYSPSSTLRDKDYDAINAGIFIGLKTELRAIAAKLIEAKYKKGE